MVGKGKYLRSIQFKEEQVIFFYGKDKAYERSGRVSDHRRPRLRATPEELHMRCRPLRWRKTRFLKILMSKNLEILPHVGHSTVPCNVEGSSYETIVVEHSTGQYPGGVHDIFPFPCDILCCQKIQRQVTGQTILKNPPHDKYGRECIARRRRYTKPKCQAFHRSLGPQ